MKKLVSPCWDLEYSYKQERGIGGGGSWRNNGRISIMCESIEMALAEARTYVEAIDGVSDVVFHVARKRSSHDSIFVVNGED